MIKNMTEHSLEKCHAYLTNLSSIKNVIQLDLHSFENLTLSDNQESNQIFENTIEIILKLLERNEKNISASSDLMYALAVLISAKTADKPDALLESFQNDSYIKCVLGKSIWYSQHSNLITTLSVVIYSLRKAYTFQRVENKNEVNNVIKARIIFLLQNPVHIDMVVYTTNLWITFLSNGIVTDKPDTIFKLIMSVVITLWNHRLVDQVKIVQILQKYLKFDYERINNSNDKEGVPRMTVFTCMLDMPWNVPFKYFIFLHILKFSILVNSKMEVFKVLESSLQEGFLKSLRSKNITGFEMELFKFYLYNISLEKWQNIFEPVLRAALKEKLMTNNFSKRWLPIILKKFPDFAEVIYSEMKNNENGVIYFRIMVSLLKECRSQNIPLDLMLDEEKFLNYLETLFSIEEEVRGDLFSLLCNLKDQSVLHSEYELKVIFSFLKYNVNSNCTMLRQNTFSSFSKFILRLVCSTTRVIKKDKNEAKQKLKQILQFLNEFNKFLIDGMKPGSSYQRRTTSLNLYKIFMTYTVHNCGGEIHKNNLIDVEKFVNFAKTEDSWKFTCDLNRKMLFRCLMDSCEEIQSLSFLILKNYFNLNGIDGNIFADIADILKDNQFYRRNCGVYLAISFISMAYKTYDSPCQALGIGDSTFTELFLRKLENKVKLADKDILDCAVNYPLDADIQILSYLITNSDSSECNVTTESQLERLILCLEKIVPLLLKALFVDKSSDYAPSFEESDKALQTLISQSFFNKSDLKYKSEEDKFQLQPIHQLLLNFIWITLKASGDIESSIITSKYRQMEEKQILRLCDLIICKLKLCRHKGVIEAAGVSLFKVVSLLTQQKICEYWLDFVLLELLELIEFKGGATISRKSAGLSILIQNIVAADKRPHKPLFTKCWTEFRRILSINYNKCDSTITEELPQTHALHFLMVLVGDTRNSSSLFLYLEEIMSICLDALKASVWAVRNASLQLFGVLLSKLVGQRNSTANFSVKHSFEEIFYSMPNILNKMIETFEQTVITQQYSRHSHLAPLLVILNNIHICNPIILETSLHEKFLCLRKLTEELLNSPVYTVRELSSKALITLHCKSEIKSRIPDICDSVEHFLLKESTFIKNENHLHGYLLFLKEAFCLYPDIRKEIPLRCILWSDSTNVAFLSQSLLYEMELIKLPSEPVEILRHIVATLDLTKTERSICVGYSQWINSVMEMCIKHYSPIELLQFSVRSYRFALIDICLKKLASTSLANNISIEILEFLLRYISENSNREMSTDVLSRVLRTISKLHRSQKITIRDIYIDEVFDLLANLSYYHFQGFNIRVLSIVMPTSLKRVTDLLKIIQEALDITCYNKCIRLNASYSMLELTKLAYTDKENIKLIWSIIVDMIQDEETDIRFIGSQCYANVFNNGIDIGPENTLLSIFDLKCITSNLLRNDAVDVLWNKLKISSFSTESQSEIMNPFDQGIVNYYSEEARVVSLAGKVILQIINSDYHSCSEYFFRNNCVHYFESHLKDILNNNVKNDFLLSSADYILCLKCFYLLGIFEKIFSNEIHKFSICDVQRITRHRKQLRKIFSENIDYWEGI